MSLTYDEFLLLIIEDGTEAARLDYARDQTKLRGAIQGFDECRNRTPESLCALLLEAQQTTAEKRLAEAPDYWFWRCREAEIHWVCNVVSAAFYHQGLPVIVPPTVNGALKAADILGTR